MWRQCVVAFGLLTLAGVSPARGQSGLSPLWPIKVLGWNTIQDFVAWQGCHAKVFRVVNSVVFQSAFQASNDPDIPSRFLFTKRLLMQAEPLILAFVVAHETGHCLQWESGQAPAALDENGNYTLAQIRGFEFDAEAYAARILTVLGYDGPHIGLDMRQYLSATDGLPMDYDSFTHGSAININEWARTHMGFPGDPYVRHF